MKSKSILSKRLVYLILFAPRVVSVTAAQLAVNRIHLINFQQKCKNNLWFSTNGYYSL